MTRMRYTTLLFLLVFNLTIADSLFAEDKDTASLTLNQAIENAISNNPRVKIAEYAMDAAEAGEIKARSGYLPKIELSEVYQKTTNPMWAFGHMLNQESITTSDFNPSRLNNPDPIDNWGTNLSISQPIYTGGKVSAYSEQAKLGRSASQKDLERTRQELVFDVTKAYYGVVLASANGDVVKEGLKASEASMEMSRSLLKAGVVVESDFLAAKVNWAENMEDDIKAANAVSLSKASLNILMGKEMEEAVTVSERLEDGLDKIGAEYGLVHDGGKQSDPLNTRPDYAGLKMMEEAAEKGVKAAKADYLPYIGAAANYEIDGESPLSADGENWTVMAMLKWNLFSGYESTARVSEARAESQRLKEVRKGMEDGIRLEVLNARLELKAARNRVYVATDTVKLAEEGYRIVQNRYREGMTTMVDLLNSAASLKKARLAHTQALYDYKIGEARLKLALGTLE